MKIKNTPCKNSEAAKLPLFGVGLLRSVIFALKGQLIISPG